MAEDNFRIVADGHLVEVDITVTLTAETVMHEFARFQKELQGIDGVMYTHIYDLPPALVRELVKAWSWSDEDARPDS